MKKKLVSILVVNYNGRKWLKNCLSSLVAQSYANIEIILVDNASGDDSISYVKTHYPQVTIIQNKKNLGFAQANNIGYEKARGEYLFLVNNDTETDKNCIQELVDAFDKIPSACSIQPKIVLMKDKDLLDQCGSYWTSLTTLYHYGWGKNKLLKKYNKVMPFFSNMGAAMMMRRDVINKIGLFDNDFWSYYEETDFCHRAWIAGYQCWYWPKATIYHAKGGTSKKFNDSFIQFHNYKNKLLSYIKNFQMVTLLTVIPTFVIVGILLSFISLLKGNVQVFISYWRSLAWNLENLKSTIKKRKRVQLTRNRSDKEIFRLVKKNPRISYYFYLFTSLKNYIDDVISL